MTTRRKVTEEVYREIVRLRREEQLGAHAISKRVRRSKSTVQTYLARIDAEGATNGQGSAPPTEDVPLAAIDLLSQFYGGRGHTQARAQGLDQPTVDAYTEAMAAGAHFPPVVLFREGDLYWIGDGYHRLVAARNVEATTITAEVREGGQREARLYACGANVTHGKPRTNADKRKAVETLLRDEVWGTWSANAIARHCGVAVSFVTGVRSSLFPENSDAGQRTYITKHGTVATMDTARIGARDTAATADASEDADAEELPAFLYGDGWTTPERDHAYARYLGLPSALQPVVAGLLNQPGICMPDIGTMLEHIARMDELQRAELVRLQASADAYERSCAITMALDRPPPPHPRIMLLHNVRAELMDLSRRVEAMAERYPDLPGADEVKAWGAHLATTANETEALIERLPREVSSA